MIYILLDTLASGMILTHVGRSGLARDLFMQLTPVCLFPEFPFLTLRLHMTTRCLTPVLSNESKSKSRSLTGSSGAEVKDLTQFVKEQVSAWETCGTVE